MRESRKPRHGEGAVFPVRHGQEMNGKGVRSQAGPAE